MIPDARMTPPDGRMEEACALVRMIRDQCPGPQGQKPTMQQVGDLLGLTDSCMYGWGKPYTGRRLPPVLPFPTLFAVRALAANLPATRLALWREVS